MKLRGLEGEMRQDPDRYTSDEDGTVVDHAANELELRAVSKRPSRELCRSVRPSRLPHATLVRTNLEPLDQQATPLKKIWCVKMMDNAHAPEMISGQLKVIRTYLKARSRLSDLLEEVPTVGSMIG